MTRNKIRLLILMVCLFFVRAVPAPIFSGYPGLEEIIEEADAVVVADYLGTSYFSLFTIGGWETVYFRVQKVLKGPYWEGQKAKFKNFRFLPIREYFPSLRRHVGQRQGRYILFLKDGTNLNCAGSSIPINFNSDLKNLDKSDIKAAVEQLVEESVKYLRQELILIRREADEVLGIPDARNPDRFNGPIDPSECQVMRGRWEWEGDTLKQDDPDSASQIVFEPAVYGGDELRFEVFVEEGEEESEGVRVHLGEWVWRIGGLANTVSILEGRENTLPATEFTLTPGAWHKIRLVIGGNRRSLAGYVDNEKILHTEPHYNTEFYGRFGLGTSNTRAKFRGVEVWEMDSQ